MTADSNEHVFALDGTAVIVHRSNPLERLSLEHIEKILSGEITDWEQCGSGKEGAIRVYSRDDNSGTFNTFKSIVFGAADLTVSAKHFESNQQLSDAVAVDPSGIGFCSLPTIGRAKALAIADERALPIYPSFLTVATEDYVLARRLHM